MRLAIRKRGLLLGLGIVATAAPSVIYVNMLFGPGARWAAIGILVLALLLNGRLWRKIPGDGMYCRLAVLSLAALSALWSSVPHLSGPKAATYGLTALAFASAGAAWAQHTRRRDLFAILWPLLALVLFAGIGGLRSGFGTVEMNADISLYRGLSANSNFLALMILTVAPLPLWRLAQRRIGRQRRLFWRAVALVLTVLVLMSLSRASLLSLTVLIAVFLLGRGFKRLAIAAATLGAVLSLLWLYFPDRAEALTQRYLFKAQAESETLIASRAETWAATLEGARAGGIFGLGFGVSYGFDDYALSASASHYGREKTNSALALIEEVGLAGAALFAGMLLLVTRGAVLAARHARHRSDRVLMALLLGYLAALFTHAQFEAWLLSPGGAATPAFWTALGMTTALAKRIRTRLKPARLSPSVAVAIEAVRARFPQAAVRSNA